MQTTSANRLYFLDWVRILAFFVLIFYHVGMYYVSWDWHVKSPAAGTALEPFMMLSSPWRLDLLFLVSGVASGFMLMKTGAGAFMRRRSVRLLVPLVFGMYLIVPPQAYFEIVEKIAYSGSYLDFMRQYLAAYQGWCRGSDCLDTPTWNHLWFVAYLFVYTLVLGTLHAALGPRFDAIAARLGAMLHGWKLVLLPLAFLAAVRIAMLSSFPTTHDLVNDWYNHAHSFFFFALGALLSRQRSVWPRMDAIRWSALGTALSCWCLLVIYFALPESVQTMGTFEYWRMSQRVVYALCGWCAMIAAIGFAHRHLNIDSARRRYLTQAVFPVYILHQSLIVVMAHAMKPAKLPPVTEGLLLVVLTLFISLGAFELLRRCRPLHLCFGIGKEAAQQQPQAPQAGAQALA